MACEGRDRMSAYIQYKTKNVIIYRILISDNLCKQNGFEETERCTFVKNSAVRAPPGHQLAAWVQRYHKGPIPWMTLLWSDNDHSDLSRYVDCVGSVILPQ